MNTKHPFIALAILLFASCVTIKEIGKVNMISNRNIDSKTTYVLLKSYAGGDRDGMKHADAESIEEAIDKTVKEVPGGEYLMNAKIYIVVKGKHFYYAAEGDVWGRGTSSVSGTKADISYQGFRAGDTVTWKNPKKIRSATDPTYFTGKIVSLKDDETCLVKCDQSGETMELDYTEIAKVSMINNSATIAPQWKIDDKVTWKNPKKFKSIDDPAYLTGVVISVKSDDETCLVKCNESGQTVEVDFDELSGIK
jgi:hypothetical protein